MVSIQLKGTGVRPEVNISLEKGLLSFGNVLCNEMFEKTFNITNVSSFTVNFDMASQVAGVSNMNHMKPFTIIPAIGTIKSNSEYTVKI